MKLNILRTCIAQFADHLASADGIVHQYKYEILSQFASRWTYETDSFEGMYDACLQSTVTRRWWKRDQYRPKEVMCALIRSEEQYAREAFKELYNEKKLVENRIDRFVFYCDELLRMYKKANPKSVVNNHYQDSVMISFYLAALYPGRYSLYPGRRIFNQALLKLDAQGTGEKDDLPRFFKLTHLINTYLLKNDAINGLIDNGLRPSGHLLLVHEFLYFMADAWQESTPV
jgi:hypothetical protein